MEKAEEQTRLDPNDIDSLWLQRQISQYVPDMSKVFELEGKILECLGKENEHEVESDLLELLNYDNFEFIKMIKVN